MSEPLVVLLTNRFLIGRTGTEMYVHDVARGLLARGHRPLVYSPMLGPLAEELRSLSIPVVDDLARMDAAPDVIHAHHSLESLVALLHFPGVPAVYVCHDATWVHDAPPLVPRIRRYIAVDHTVLDRLVFGEGVPESRVSVVYNGVDLARFQPRGPLPDRPRRALVFSNYVQPQQLRVVQATCRDAGLELDAIGRHLGGECQRPEDQLVQYDLVFAKGRCAWEALACGVSVVVFDAQGCGPLVTSDALPALQRANFGRRLLQQPIDHAVLARQLSRYSAEDAAEVSRQVRAACSLDRMLDRLIAMYGEVVAEQQQCQADLTADLRTASSFLRHWAGVRTRTPSGSLVAAERNPYLAVPPTLNDGQLRQIVREELSHRRSSIAKALWRAVRRLPGKLGRRAA